MKSVAVKSAPVIEPPARGTPRRAYWLKTLHQWHWISSAVCLVAMLLFTATGITLNHAAKIEAAPRVDNHMLELPAPLLAQLHVQGDVHHVLGELLSGFLAEMLQASHREREQAIGEARIGG